MEKDGFGEEKDSLCLGSCCFGVKLNWNFGFTLLLPCQKLSDTIQSIQNIMDCIFCKISKGEAPAHKIWEDAKYISFLFIFPNTEGFRS